MRTHGHTVENCILEKQADELSRYTNSLPDNVSHLHTLWNVEPPLHVKGFQPENNMDESEKKFYTMRYDTIRVSFHSTILSWKEVGAGPTGFFQLRAASDKRVKPVYAEI